MEQSRRNTAKSDPPKATESQGIFESEPIFIAKSVTYKEAASHLAKLGLGGIGGGLGLIIHGLPLD